MIKGLQFFLFLMLTFSYLCSSAQVLELNNYLKSTSLEFDDQKCDCSTQNIFQVPIYLAKSMYPYRGDFAKASREILFNDRFKNKANADPLFKELKEKSQVAYYENFWDPVLNNRKSKLVDFNLMRIVNYDSNLKFSKSIFSDVNSDLNNWMMQEQNVRLLQSGEITNYQNLKSHCYSISLLDTKIDSRNLGIYFIVTHYYNWHNNFYSACFKFNHEPNSDDLEMIHQFLLNFGEPCTLKSFSKDQLLELESVLSEYYILAFEKLYPRLLDSEKKEVLDCSIEKLRQYYTFDEITNGQFDESLFDEITTGCIEFLKLNAPK